MSYKFKYLSNMRRANKSIKMEKKRKEKKMRQKGQFSNTSKVED